MRYVRIPSSGLVFATILPCDVDSPNHLICFFRSKRNNKLFVSNFFRTALSVTVRSNTTRRRREACLNAFEVS